MKSPAACLPAPGQWPSREADVEEVDVDKLKAMVEVTGRGTSPHWTPTSSKTRAGAAAVKVARTLVRPRPDGGDPASPTVVPMPWGHLANGHLGLLMLSPGRWWRSCWVSHRLHLMGMGVFFAWLAYRSGDPTSPCPDPWISWCNAYAVMTNDVLISIPVRFMGYLVERANLSPSSVPRPRTPPRPPARRWPWPPW